MRYDKHEELTYISAKQVWIGQANCTSINKTWALSLPGIARYFKEDRLVHCDDLIWIEGSYDGTGSISEKGLVEPGNADRRDLPRGEETWGRGHPGPCPGRHRRLGKVDEIPYDFVRKRLSVVVSRLGHPPGVISMATSANFDGMFSKDGHPTFKIT